MKVKKANKSEVIAKLNDLRSTNNVKEVIRYSNGFMYAYSYIYEMFKRTSERSISVMVCGADNYDKYTVVNAIQDVLKTSTETYYIAETPKYFIYVLYNERVMTQYHINIVVKRCYKWQMN